MAIVTTRGSPALVRGGPSMNRAVVGYRNNGDVVEVMQRRAGWAQIGTGQWINEDYLRETHGRGADVIPHPRRPHNPRWRILANFPTNSNALRPEHKNWLRSTAAGQARAGQRIWVRGLASHLGDTGANQILSENRAIAVYKFLIQECGVDPHLISGIQASVGEHWARGSTTDNNGRWRAVEVIISSNVIELPAEFITAPSPRGTVFYIKFIGGGGGGEGIELHGAAFIIRNSNNDWQKYAFLGGGDGLSAIPVGWGDGMPHGQGWVQFTTETPVSVSDFGGAAGVIQAGAQLNEGISYYWLNINLAIDMISLPTGTGVASGHSEVYGYFSPSGGVHHNHVWEVY